jgi:hypothetical protein
MSAEHLPECHRRGVADVDPESHDALLRSIYPVCICDRLRACRERTLDEARDAVTATAPPWAVKFYVPQASNGEWVTCAHTEVAVIAAIDGLRGQA